MFRDHVYDDVWVFVYVLMFCALGHGMIREKFELCCLWFEVNFGECDVVCECGEFVGPEF